MPKEEGLRLTGEVIEALPNAFFRVRLDIGVIIAHLSGKMRVHYIRVLPGDWVVVECSPYDLTKGRIVTRLRPEEALAHQRAASAAVPPPQGREEANSPHLPSNSAAAHEGSSLS